MTYETSLLLCKIEFGGRFSLKNEKQRQALYTVSKNAPPL